MAGEVLLVTQFLAAGLMLVLAPWLLYLNFHSRVVRAFSLFLLLRAMSILSNQIGRVTDSFRFWEGLRGYYDLAVVPALVYFLVAYAGRVSDLKTRRLGWSLLGLVTVIEVLYAIDHCFALCSSPATGDYQVGPLGPFVFGFPLAYAGAAIVLARQATRADTRPRRAGAFLVAVAFFLNALFETSSVLGGALITGIPTYLEDIYDPTGWEWVPLTTYSLAFLVAAWAGALILRNATVVRTRRITVAAAAVGALASGVFLAFFEPADDVAITYRSLVFGLWRTALAVIVTVGIMRHRLFGIDLRARKGISRSVVAGSVLACFFVVSKLVEKGAETFFADQFDKETAGMIAGSIGAGLLLFAISPLQRLAERVGEAAVPLTGSRNSRNTSERLAFYRDQAEIAWSDGVLGRRERLLLDQLRERLGLEAGEAAAIEHQIALPGTKNTRVRRVARRKAHSSASR